MILFIFFYLTFVNCFHSIFMIVDVAGKQVFFRN